MIDTNYRKFIQKPLDKFVLKICKNNITPNTITLLALFTGLMAAITFVMNIPTIVSILLLWLSGFLDVIDGTLARLKNLQSKFGTVLDITSDRIVEASLVIALVIKNNQLSFLAICLLSSILISMCVFLSVGAASTNDSEKSFKYQAGFAERTEGFIMFSLIMIFTKFQHELLIVFIIMIVITIIQRFYEAYKLLD